MSVKTTDPTSRKLSGLERNNGDVSEFHESVSARRSDTKIVDAQNESIEDTSNVLGVYVNMYMLRKICVEI